MEGSSFYNSITYKERQAEITRENWQNGIYDFLRKRKKRQCANSKCGKWFEIKPADIRKFCSRKCAAQVNNTKRSNISLAAKEEIKSLYQKGLSMQEIADKIGCGIHPVVYWMQKFNIPRRSHSESAYAKWNPKGDPFKIKKLKTRKDFELFNLGIGLFLGEGGKQSKHSVVISNTNPKILKLFLRFLKEICRVKHQKVRAALNIFDDVDLKTALNFWQKAVGIPRSMFVTSIVRKSRGGTYKNKSPYGTLTIYVTNIKLKTLLDEWCKNALNYH